MIASLHFSLSYCAKLVASFLKSEKMLGQGKKEIDAECTLCVCFLFADVQFLFEDFLRRAGFCRTSTFNSFMFKRRSVLTVMRIASTQMCWPVVLRADTF